MSGQVQLSDAEPSSSHIKQLCKIDQDVVDLLKHAGNAIKALTEDTSSLETLDVPQFADRRARFSEAAGAYFDTLSSIDVNLRREIVELKKADIIPSEEESLNEFNELGNQAMEETTEATIAWQKGMRKNTTTSGGLGHLDVGWLNSRNASVGKETEANLWEKSLEHVQTYKIDQRPGLAQDPSPQASPGRSNQTQPEPMDED